MTEQGTDRYGAEYKRTGNDFHVRYLEQDNGVCSVCHGTGAKIEIRYVVRNYESAKVKKTDTAVEKEVVEKVAKAPAKKATKKIPANKNVEYTATGRRKNSIARVRLIPNGKGQFTINKVDIEKYRWGQNIQYVYRSL